MARGAGVICANSQSGVDDLLLYCYRDKNLGRDNIGVIEFQMKNDMQYGKTIHPYLFDAMDPFHIGVFDDECDELPDGPMPVIRIVAALASKEIS
ncbi:hypothetical protein EW145_g3079 [Phellinidium pouzarii]|uniref:Uncharacterized protein n=1 Tax=Phellinidium pouzarii TaxID=167371 RepID=A0A4S4L8P8_9AGAM|nr:hypothetical protein EW145_g3079 [Phellinidium pouzarii]